MKVGDLVTYVTAFDLKPRTGVIVKIVKEGSGPFGMNVYQILQGTGELCNCTSAAVRPFKMRWRRESNVQIK
jgi:hypothetical protein